MHLGLQQSQFQQQPMDEEDAVDPHVEYLQQLVGTPRST
jgi:hypothetical protein